MNSTNIKEYRYLLDKRTAKFLVNLTLKKWIVFREVNEIEKEITTDDITDLHLKTLLEIVLISPRQQAEQPEDQELSHKVDVEILQILIKTMQKFCSDMPDIIEISIGMLVLLTNILSYMVEYEILDTNNIETSPFVELITKIFQNEEVACFNAYREEREVMKFLNCINDLDMHFSDSLTNKQIISLVKDLIPVDFLKRLLTELKGMQ